jgi:uncharacterized protein
VGSAVAETAARSVESLPAEWEVTRLAEVIRAHLPALRERYGVERVALFGSYVRNEQGNNSDLDVLVTLSRTLSLLDRVGLRDDLADTLGVPVDVAVRDQLQARLARVILREAIDL